MKYGSTKYEQNQRKRFNRRMDERRERFERLARFDPCYDMYEPWADALTTLLHGLALIDEETLRLYLADRNVNKEE